jgi:hypothetical protein
MKHIISTLVIFGTILVAASAQNISTVAPAPSGPAYAIFGCALSSSAVIGTPSDSTASGVFIGFYDGKNNLTYYIMHNVEGALAVNLHDNATATENGPILHSTPTFVSNTLITGSFKIARPNLANMFNNKQYFQVTSATHPQGAIRGSVTLAPYGFQYVAMLDIQSTATPSTSKGVGLMIGSTSGKYFGVSMQHNVPDFTNAAVLGTATYCNTAPNTIFNFTSNGKAISEVFETATDADKTNLEAGNYYIQITSESNPLGDIRGQIQPTTFYTSKGLQTFANKPCRDTAARSGAAQTFGVMTGLASLLVLPFVL